MTLDTTDEMFGWLDETAYEARVTKADLVRALIQLATEDPKLLSTAVDLASPERPAR